VSYRARGVSEQPLPFVSVVVVNYESADDTARALTGLAAIDWPADRWEVVVVDNGSRDGSVETLAAQFPTTRFVELDRNQGFAGGCNRGAQAARGDYIAFLNNDARPDRRWIRAAMDVFLADRYIACVASKVLDWDGTTIDFVDAGIAFYGHGFKLGAGDPDDHAHDLERDVPFASGAAMIVRADAFREVGGFDERYFLFFEDVDLGWRFWLLGYRVRYVPASLAYHRHHATMDRFGSWNEQYLLERNALFTIFKNYDDANLRRVLPAALALAVRRGVTLGGDNTHALDLERAGADGGDARMSVSKQTLAGAYAVDAFLEALPELAESRRQIQAARVRPDAEVLGLFRLPLFANLGDASFVRSFDAAVDTLGVADVFGTRRNVLILTGDVIAPKMAGPAIRAWHMAGTLSREHDVVLAAIQDCELSSPDFTTRRVDADGIAELERWADVIVFQGVLMRQYPFLRRSTKVLVVDVYDPFHLEVLEQSRGWDPDRRLYESKAATETLNEQLTRGDYFLCASDKQRDFWLGQLAGVGRINPLTYDRTESMASLISVVPFGIPEDEPRHTRAVLRDVVPGIGPDDKVVLWGGGVYNWFDPLTLLHAVDKLRRRVPDVRLFFLGLQHPNPEVPEMRMATQTQELAGELGLTGTHVFFNEGWVDYDDRQNYLLESDVGVSTHLDHVETAFSYRTRVLDYVWAALPVVATGGDALAGLIEGEELGLTVPPDDVDALEAALFRLLDDDALHARCREQAGRLAPRLRWSETLRPLMEFCSAPRRSADLLDPLVAATIRSPLEGKVWPDVGWRADLRKTVGFIRKGQWRKLGSKLRKRVRRSE
jgi:GT2 family glycosyltransferase/glycosyltransferase involved in cell wall biosynthesis